MNRIHNGTILKSVQPTITAGAYSAGDVVGGLMTFALGSQVAGMVRLRRVIIGDAANVKAAMDLWIFNAAPATIADNAAFSAVTDAEVRDTCQAHLAIATGDYTTAGANALGEKMFDPERTIELPAGSFYVYAVCSATPTYTAATDLRFTFEVVPD